MVCHVEKFILNLSNSSFVPRVNPIHLDHPCSFIVYYLFVVFLELPFSVYRQFEGNFVRCQIAVQL